MGVLRFLLAIAVVIVHSSPVFGFQMMEGFIAVQAFYIISGFYMTLILNEKYVGTKDSYWLFISNRYLRLYPIYIVIVLLTLLLSVLFGVFLGDYGKLSRYLAHADTMQLPTLLILILSNLTLLGQDILTFVSYSESTGFLYFTQDFISNPPKLYGFMFISVAWTVSLELNYYLVAPFIVKRGLGRPVMIIFLCIGIRVLLYAFGYDNFLWIYRFFPTELIFFMFGSFSYAIYQKIKINPPGYSKFFLYGILAYVLLFHWLPGYYGKILFFYALVLLGIPFIFQKSKKNAVDRYIGELSYPIYLVHPLVLMITQANRFPKIESLGTTTLVLTICGAIILHEIISKPVEKIRQSRFKNSAAS